MDAVSMFHPLLYQSVANSDIGSNKKVALMVLSPMDCTTLKVNGLIEKVLNTKMENAFTRIEADWDNSCEIGIGGLRTFQRWLSAILPGVVDKIEKSQPTHTRLNQLYEQRQEEEKNFEKVFPGTGDSG